MFSKQFILLHTKCVCVWVCVATGVLPHFVAMKLQEFYTKGDEQEEMHSKQKRKERKRETRNCLALDAHSLYIICSPWHGKY